jgi:hypothetical protein
VANRLCYLAKYLTRSTEDFGLDGYGKVHSAADARYLSASPHAVRIIETAEQITAPGGEDYARLADRYGTLGYRGHVLTKTRRDSTTFGALRQTRRTGATSPNAGLASIRTPPCGNSGPMTTRTATRPTSWSNANGATSAPATSTPTAPPGP